MHTNSATPFDTPTPTPQNARPPRAKLYGPGRPRALDDGKLREICALIAGGCGLSDAARYVECSVSTIRREADRNPAFLEQIRHAEKHASLSPLRAMQQAMGTHWRAAAWMLERAFPDRFSRPEPSAFGQREARALMKEIMERVNIDIRDPFQARCLRKGIRRAFDRYIRTATDRRQNAHNLRVSMKALENDHEPLEPTDDLQSLMQASQLHGDRAADFSQKLTAENPFYRHAEPVGHTTFFPATSAPDQPAIPDPLHEPTQNGSNPTESQSPPDFNIR